MSYPSLKSLRAAEAVGRFGSLSRAASFLNVTPSAVSHQLRVLEEQLGISVFDRTDQGLVPTEKGRQLLSALTEGFQTISDGLAAIADQPNPSITVSCGLAFAARFLVPRLISWNAKHPDTELLLATTNRLVDFDREDIDVAIRFGAGDWPQSRAEKIADQPIELVCAPELARTFQTETDKSSLPLIVDEQSQFTWAQWSDDTGAGCLEPSVHPHIRVPDASLAYEAAVSGQGLWLAWPALTHDAVAAGKLTRIPIPQWHAGFGYWAVSTPARWRRPQVRNFRAWLREAYGAIV
ncbi:LysR substrate-binding domain-containing protein [uncultured Nitratireductor sp.]|uniref:LysR substrate-binding domain-containing protein n=1 Tax=uncultured Nitratireductor sp. TaxID=520953 RepID=UPI0025CBF9E3|nr:LysR substrate-binding domain-containing protein [uncultured Nitratireductor sp.]